MIRAVITDFSRVLLFPKDDTYKGGLNVLNNELLAENPGYNFLEVFKINEGLLTFYSELNKTTPVHVFTSETIQEHPAVRQEVLGAVSSVLSAQKIGINKSEASAYEKILEIVAAKPSEAIYVDDKQSNLDAAAAAGLETVLHTVNDSTIEQLSALVR